jgi:hypothetical protein
MVEVLVAIVLSVSVTPSSAPQPSQSVEKQAQPTQVNTAANPKGSPETNPPVKKERSESDQRASKKENKETYEQGFMERIFELVREHDPEVVAISTAIIALFTVTLSVFTFLLWFGGERHSKRELRAYLSVIPGRCLIHKGNPPHINGVVCIVKNHGRTPAFEMNFVFGISVLPIGAELPTATGKISENAAIFPEAHINTVFNQCFSSDETANVMKGTHRLHIWGQATYRDAFRKRRITRFSASLGGQDFANNFQAVQQGRPLPPTFSWTFEDRHNDAT